jgi:hypothetical protein
MGARRAGCVILSHQADLIIFNKIFMKKNISILVIAVIIALGVGFFSGAQYQKQATKKAAFQGPSGQGFNRSNFSGATGTQRNRNGAGFTAGEILSKNDSKSITVKLVNGGSEIVFLSDSSQIMKSATGTIADLNVGEQVVVSGTANSDGSITAKSIQLGVRRPSGAGPEGVQNGQPGIDGQVQGGKGQGAQAPQVQR